MKKHDKKKLVLEKQTIRALSDARLGDVAGGSGDRGPQSKDTCSDRCSVLAI